VLFQALAGRLPILNLFEAEEDSKLEKVFTLCNNIKGINVGEKVSKVSLCANDTTVFV